MHELLHRHQFNRSDTQNLQVADYGWMGDSQISAAKLGRNVGMPHGKTLHMNFVDHGLIPWRPKRPLIAPIAPIKIWIGNDGSLYERSGIEVVARAVRPREVMSEYRFAPFHLSLNAFGIWVQEQFCRIAAKTGRGQPWPMQTKPVFLSGLKTGEVSMPAQCG